MLFSIPVDFRNAYFHVAPLVDSFLSDLSQFIKANKHREQSKKTFIQKVKANFEN